MPDTNIPLVSSEDAQKLMAELAEARARADAAEKKLHKFTDVPRGMATPEPAQDYVMPDDTSSFPQLNELNSAAVVQDAIRAGKSSFTRSHVTHRQTVPHDPRGGQAATFWMYDDGGYARRVQRQSVSSAVASGLHPVCPLCNGWHKESETNPNICPNRQKVAYTVCQICRSAGYKRYIYDTQERPPLDDDGNELGPSIDDDPFYKQAIKVASEPEDRLRVRLEQHIRAYHPNTAASMKLTSA